MDITDFNLEDLLLAAIKSEMESKAVYEYLANKVPGAFLSDKLRFIAQEEQKHREFLEGVFKMYIQKPVGELPLESPVPLPEISIDQPFIQASDVMFQAMKAEEAASDFYRSLSERFDKDEKTKETLIYLAQMELGHYRLLEVEKEHLENTEDYEIQWEMSF
ncbi:MAG: ferritin family protein [Candidatus Thermoplasmatota archaeon]|nr:ferritin family protein [Candidatus Thermoplasmatota archaeon]